MRKRRKKQKKRRILGNEVRLQVGLIFIIKLLKKNNKI